MTMRVEFDPLMVAPGSLQEAVNKVSGDLTVTFHNSRELTTPKPKVATVVVRS